MTAGVAIIYLNRDDQKLSASEKLLQIKGTAPTISEAIELNVGEIIKKDGIIGALEVIKLAFSEKQIYLNDCHALSHFVGHYAPGYYSDNFDKLVEESTTFCVRGYIHGAEGQIATDGNDYIERLNKLCVALKKDDPNFFCFHGAGHAFLNATVNVNEAIDLCKTLSDDPQKERDIKSCIDGIFAEVTNLAGKYDGETGRKLAGPAPISLEVSPLDYCAQFDPYYHAVCAYEVNALPIGDNTSPEEAGRIMKRCVTDAANTTISQACLYNVASAYVSHEIEIRGKVTFQEWILDETKETRLLYLTAVGQELAQHITAGHEIETTEFCNSFKESDELDLCQQQIHSLRNLVPILEK